jgi:aldehyde:ferredoxin oxidoreductase
MCIATGPMVGTFMPSAMKTVCSLKGPTGFYISSPTSNFGRFLKYAGYDGIIIRGKSERPVYLEIINDDVRLREADHLWGMDIFQATDKIKEETENACVACIGPAGENLVSFANIIIDKQGTWSRSGDGCVMGSKNLKGIAVRGTRGVKVADPKRFHGLVNDYFSKLRDEPNNEAWNRVGLLIGWEAWIINSGKFVTDNFSNTAPSDMMTELYGPKAYEQEVRAVASHCHTCPIGCKSGVEVKSGEFSQLKLLSSAMISVQESLGAKCRVGDYNHLIKSAHTLNRYGIDNLTFGSKMDLLCDLYQKGIIGLDFTMGWVPRRGYDATMELIEMVAYRKGVGDIISRTWQDMAEILPDGGEHVVHIKGTDPANDFRTHVCTENFGQLVSPRGGHNMNALSITIVPHRKLSTLRKFGRWIGIPEDQIDAAIPSESEPEYVPGLTKWVEDYNVMLLNLGLCNRPPYQRLLNPAGCAELYRVVTGIEVSAEEMLEAGERSLNMERLFNCREGYGRNEDNPPKKWLSNSTEVEGKKIGPLSKAMVDEMLNRYYQERGWDKEGIPDQRKLKELGIMELAKETRSTISDGSRKE